MRRQLILVTAAATTMVVIAFLVPLALLIRSLAAERALTEARQAAQSLAPVLAGGPEGLELAITVAQGRLGVGRLGVYLPDGTSVGAAPADPDVIRARGGEAFTRATGDGRVVYQPVFAPPRGVAVVRVTVTADALTAGVATSWLVLGAVGLALVGGAVLLADRLGRAAVAPAREVAEAARRLGERDLAARAPEAGPAEIAGVARALNHLAVRIAGLLAAERERAADLSHRLRTPLTALRLDVESLVGGSAGERLTEDIDALERAVDQIILEARRPLGDEVSATDLVAVARNRVAFWHPLAEDQGRRWELRVEAGESVPVPVEPTELAAAIDALLSNVLAHTPDGAGCTVRVERDGADVRLIVEDEGPGMPGDFLLQRGVSGGGSTGLGLDIARRTARSAGGDLEVRAGDGGAQIVLRFPAGNGLPP